MIRFESQIKPVDRPRQFYSGCRFFELGCDHTATTMSAKGSFSHFEDCFIGNIGIAGHRDGFFRGLKDVTVGDLLELETLSGTDTYQITEISIVKPEQVEVLEPTGPANPTGASVALQALQQRGVFVTMLTGDHQTHAAAAAASLGVAVETELLLS